VYILKLILAKEFLNDANEEKFTILGGKLFQGPAVAFMPQGPEETVMIRPCLSEYS